jgi:hypothetical protein
MINSLLEMDSWSGFSLIYFPIGSSILIVLIAQQIKNMPSTFTKNMMRAIGYKKNVKAIFQDWLVYILASAIILCGWPIFLIWLAHYKRQEVKDLEWRNRSKLKSTHKYLTVQVSKEFAESDNFIFDPLGYTPNVPFGYLNQAWHMFLKSKFENDELWYFKIPKGKPVGKYELETNAEINGIALLRGGEIIDEFFITSD